MKNYRKMYLMLMMALLMVACENNDVAMEKAKDFGLMDTIAKKASIVPQGDGIKVSVNADDILNVKRASTDFATWNKLEPGVVIESGGLKIIGDKGDNIEYSVGNSADGKIQVLVINYGTGELYALYADGIM